mmetsp:Transcript_76503/g.165554  ORF Transcript_76503/g.165554 Transcript_76503/m.165554 type:complete len:197 (-) Transcript_76503:120-710(-)
MKAIMARGLVGTVSFYVLFFIANQAPLGEIFTLFSMSIIWSSFGAHIILKEQLNKSNLFSIATCIVGVILIQRPEFIFPSEEDNATLFPYRTMALFAAFINSFVDAFVTIILRYMKKVPAEISTFSFAFWSILGSSTGMLLTESVPLAMDDLAVAVAMGLLGLMGTLFNAKALQYMEVKKNMVLKQSLLIYTFIFD